MKTRALFLLFWLASALPVFAVQGSGCMPTTGTVSGLVFSQNITAGIAALISSNSGASAPSTDCSAAPVKGQLWLDTSVTPNVLRQFDGAANWVALGAIDGSNHIWNPPIGGGTAALTAATTTDLWSTPASSITISGTTSITAFASASAVPGAVKLVMASAVFTIKNDATALILPGGGDITTAVGDRFFVNALNSTNVAVVGYSRADGSSLVNPSVPLGTVLYGDYGTIPAKTVYGQGQALSRASYPAYLAAATRAQSATLTAGNNTITSVGNTAGLGAGMPLEGTGIQFGTVISSITSSTIVMSKTATANGSQTVRAFITGYGSGGDSTTVGVKNCQGMVVAGRDPSATNLSGAGVINSSQGASTKTLVTLNLPPYTPAGSVGITDPGHAHQIQYQQSPGNGTSNYPATTTSQFSNSVANAIWGGGGPSGLPAITNTTGITAGFSGSAQGGTSTPFSIVQPTSIAECVVVVLP